MIQSFILYLRKSSLLVKVYFLIAVEEELYWRMG